MRRTCSDALLLSFMLLSALLTQLPHLSAHGPADRSVHTVHRDSRQIGQMIFLLPFKVQR